MPSETDHPAWGRIVESRNGTVIFNPLQTNYRLHLKDGGGEVGASAGARVKGIIRVPAYKIWTVPSGGNFIVPIQGPPRTIQGRVRDLSEQWMVVHAGVPIVVPFPDDDTAFDLNNGPITVGTLVNVHAAPEATFQLL